MLVGKMKRFYEPMDLVHQLYQGPSRALFEDASDLLMCPLPVQAKVSRAIRAECWVEAAVAIYQHAHPGHVMEIETENGEHLVTIWKPADEFQQAFASSKEIGAALVAACIMAAIQGKRVSIIDLAMSEALARAPVGKEMTITVTPDGQVLFPGRLGKLLQQFPAEVTITRCEGRD